MAIPSLRYGCRLARNIPTPLSLPSIPIFSKLLLLPIVRGHHLRAFSISPSFADKSTSPDILIVGSGAAALTAALRAKSRNLHPLVIEKTPLVGGTTCYSGGALWIPNSGIHASNVSDSFDDALKYMQHTIDVQPTKSSSLERKIAYLKNGPDMVNFLTTEGFKWVPTHGYPDYYPSIEGGKPLGRTIEGEVFDLKKLGDWRNKMRKNDLLESIPPMYTFEVGGFYRYAITMNGFLSTAKVVLFRILGHKLLGRDSVTMGRSLLGQLLLLCLKKEVQIEVDCSLKELVVKDGSVKGAVVIKNGKEQIIKANKGVILAAGGFARNTFMRKQYQHSAAANSKTLVSPGDQGDAITAATKIGAATELMDEAWWGAVIVDGTGVPTWAQYERQLPHSIIVDQAGNRFANESGSYVRLINSLFAHQKKTGLSVPAFFIFDSNHMGRYANVGMAPGTMSQSALESGLYTKADTLDELAQKLGIDVAGLNATVSRFNGFVKSGVDEDFERGQSLYDNYFGDPNYEPNPNLGAVQKPPFFGAKLVTGDIGTKGGLLTDEYARVLRDDGTVIEGLYAAGNTTASVMGRDYIGAGSTLGPALIFAYIAANHLAN